MSLGGEYRILSPEIFLAESSDAFSAFYLDIRQALRVAVGEMNGENFLFEQSLIVVRLKELLVPRAAQLGIELTRLDAWEAIPIGSVRK